MIEELKNTSASDIAAAILKARRNLGTASGLVFTLVVVTDSRHFNRVLGAAMESGREHPSRILVVVFGHAAATRLDAEIHTGEGVPGDVVALHLSGELTQHADSVVLPLLLPDSPVVIWWPNECPIDPADDPIGALGTRRITDSSGSADHLAALIARAGNHAPGDTDLAWTRLTPWRALLAAALDQYHGRITGALVEAAPGNAPAELMAAWLETRLSVQVDRVPGPSGGITSVRLHSLAGDVAVSRQPGNSMACYNIPGQPPREVALPRRDIQQLITEELRRMDPDDIFEQVVAQVLVRAKRGEINVSGRSQPRVRRDEADQK